MKTTHEKLCNALKEVAKHRSATSLLHAKQLSKLHNAEMRERACNECSLPENREALLKLYEDAE